MVNGNITTTRKQLNDTGDINPRTVRRAWISRPKGATTMLAPTFERLDEIVDYTVEAGRLQDCPNKRNKVALSVQPSPCTVSHALVLYRMPTSSQLSVVSALT